MNIGITNDLHRMISVNISVNTYQIEHIFEYILHVAPFPVRTKIYRFRFVCSYGRTKIVLYKSKVDTINMTERLQYK